MNTPCNNCGADLRVCKDCEIYNGYIAVPKDVTNGDMIEIMFPNCVKDNDFCGAVITSLNGETQYWKSEWWNSPYKGGQDE